MRNSTTDHPDPTQPLPVAERAPAQPLAYARPTTAIARIRSVAILAMVLCVPFFAAPFLAFHNHARDLRFLIFCAFGCPAAAALLALFVRPSYVARRLATIALIIACVELAVSAGTYLLPSNPGSGNNETRRRYNCSANLRTIGQALYMYANDYNGRLPATLDLLIADANCDLAAETFICPDAKQAPATGPTTAQVIQVFRAAPAAHCSYVYCYTPIPVSSLTPSYVLLYEPLANHAQDGMNVMFGDGHSEWMQPAAARQLLSELQSGHNPPRAMPP